jgi:hypothetical protein
MQQRLDASPEMRLGALVEHPFGNLKYAINVLGARRMIELLS